MTDTIMQAGIWIAAGGIMVLFLKRRRSRRSYKIVKKLNHYHEGRNEMEFALQGAIWLGAGITLVMLLSRRRRRRIVR